MKNYTVTFSQIVYYSVDIQADNDAEAEDLAFEQLNNAEELDDLISETDLFELVDVVKFDK